MEKFKEVFIMIFTVAGTLTINFFGGIDTVLTALIFFICIDYLTGLLVALVFKKSKKTENGSYESYVGFKGIVKKVIILVCVAATNQLDLALGFSGYIRTLVIMFFIANEFLSIIENTGLMGVRWPKAIQNMLEVLRDKVDNTEIDKEVTKK